MGTYTREAVVRWLWRVVTPAASVPAQSNEGLLFTLLEIGGYCKLQNTTLGSPISLPGSKAVVGRQAWGGSQ